MKFLSNFLLALVLVAACGSAFATCLKNDVNTDQFAIAGWTLDGSIVLGPLSYSDYDCENVSGNVQICATVCGVPSNQPCTRSTPCCPTLNLNGSENIDVTGNQNHISCSISKK